MKKLVLDFIDRNKPIFYIGALTAAIFLAIILLSQKQKAYEPELVEVKEEDFISEHTPVTGPENAKVVIIEFSDYECPTCANYQKIVDGLLTKYPNDIQLAFRHFPLPQHKNAQTAAVAAQAAYNQGKFWEYSKVLFANNTQFAREKLISLAESLGLNKQEFETDLSDPLLEAQVRDDITFGERLGINAAPTFYVNGKAVNTNLETEVRKEIERVNPATTTQETTQSVRSAQSQQVDDKYGILEIRFTNNGFTPKNTRAVPGQLVRVKNETSNYIVLEQKTYLVKEIGRNVEIAAGEYFEFRVGNVGMKDVIWTFGEKTTGNIGSVLIISEKK